MHDQVRDHPGLHSDLRASQSSVVRLTTDTSTEHFSLPKASLVEKGFRGACINSFVLEKQGERAGFSELRQSASPSPPPFVVAGESAAEGWARGSCWWGVARSDRGRGQDLHVSVSETCALCSGQR